MATGTITNRILDPSGTAVPNVVVNARLMPGIGFRTGTYYEIAQLETTTTDASGDWSLTLEINTDITPGDTYYEVEECIPPAWGVPAVWAIQVASGTHTLYASLVNTPPGQAVPSYITQSSGDARYLQPGAGITGGPIRPVGTTTVTGTATIGAPANHEHPLSPAVAGTGLTLSAGVLSVTDLAPAAGNEITAVGTNTATGTTTTFARTNHGHALNPSIVGTGLTLNAGVLNAALAGSLIQPVGVNTTTGTSTAFARENHAHVLSPAVVGNDLSLAAGVLSVNPRVPAVGALPTVIATNTVTGTATQYAPANHGHVLGATVAGNDITVVDGVVSVSPRVPLTSGLIQAVGTATITGTATSYAVGNHQHPLSPAIVGNDLSLAAGVLSVSPRVPLAGSLIQAVGTNTQTGTSTAYAVENHVHILSPAVVGSGLTLTNGVLSAPPAGLAYGGAQDITGVSTATATGTATTVARADHQHPLSPAVIGSGLALTSGIAAAKNLVNSNAATGTLFTITSTNTATATVAQGQFQYNSNSVVVNIFSGNVNLPIGPLTGWTTFTPTLSQNGTIAKTVSYAAYIRVGRLIIANVSLAITGTGSAGSYVVVGLPVTAAASQRVIGTFWYSRSGVSDYPGAAFMVSTTAVQGIGWAQGDYIGASPSFATANNDTVTYSVMYEAAS